jgi:hypothetical protein
MADLASLVDYKIGQQTVMPTPDVMGAVVKGAQVAQLQQQTQAGYQQQNIEQQNMQRQQQLRGVYQSSVDPTTGQVDPDKLTYNLYAGGFGPEAMSVNKDFLDRKLNAAQVQTAQLSNLNTKSMMVANAIYGLKLHTGDLFDNPDKYVPGTTTNVPVPATTNAPLTDAQRMQVAQQAINRYPNSDITNINSGIFTKPMTAASIANPGANTAPYTVTSPTTSTGVTPPQMGAYQAAYQRLADLGFADKIQTPEQFQNDPATAVNQLNSLYDESGQYFKAAQAQADLALKNIDTQFKLSGIKKEQSQTDLNNAKAGAVTSKSTGGVSATPDASGLVSVDRLPKDSGVKKLVDNWITQRQSGSSRNILTNQVAAINTAKEGLSLLDQNPTGLQVQKVMQDLGGLKTDPWIGSTAANVLAQVTGLEKGTLSQDKISDLRGLFNSAIIKAQNGIKQTLTIPAGYAKYKEVQDIVHTYDGALQPGASGGMVKVNSKAQRDALPAGTKYIGSDGKTYTKGI